MAVHGIVIDVRHVVRAANCDLASRPAAPSLGVVAPLPRPWASRGRWRQLGAEQGSFGEYGGTPKRNGHSPLGWMAASRWFV